MMQAQQITDMSIPQGLQYRRFYPDAGSDGLVKGASVASEYAALQENEEGVLYVEILKHGKENIDFSLIKDAPILWDHDESTYLGDVKDFWLQVEEKKTRADLQFSSGGLGREIYNDFTQYGIRKALSLGYVVHDGIFYLYKNMIYLIANYWGAVEVSSVPVPADPTIGLGR